MTEGKRRKEKRRGSVLAVTCTRSSYLRHDTFSSKPLGATCPQTDWQLQLSKGTAIPRLIHYPHWQLPWPVGWGQAEFLIGCQVLAYLLYSNSCRWVYDFCFDKVKPTSLMRFFTVVSLQSLQTINQSLDEMSGLNLSPPAYSKLLDDEGWLKSNTTRSFHSCCFLCNSAHKRFPESSGL